MILCAAGDIHGALDRMYEDVLAFEAALGVRFEWVLHVGDFGVWPDPTRIDKATRNHDGAGDFPLWWAERREAPRRTVFVEGNHRAPAPRSSWRREPSRPRHEGRRRTLAGESCGLSPPPGTLDGAIDVLVSEGLAGAVTVMAFAPNRQVLWGAGPVESPLVEVVELDLPGRVAAPSGLWIRVGAASSVAQVDLLADLGRPV